MVLDSIDELVSEAVVSRRGQAIALVLAVLISIALGLAGWMLPSYGGSLVVPTAIVFGMGAALALEGGILASFRPRRFGDLWLFTFAVAVLADVRSVMSTTEVRNGFPPGAHRLPPCRLEAPFSGTYWVTLNPDRPRRGGPAEPVRRSLAAQPLRGTRQSYS